VNAQRLYRIGFVVLFVWCVVEAATAQPQKGNEEEFKPVADDIVPLGTRVVTVELRNTPLRDALYSIADAAGLNLVIERGVNPEVPVTMSIKNVKAEEAIRSILNGAGYFFTLQGNILTIKAIDTRIFEFGQPPLIQQYSIDVGGDILGTAMQNAGGGSQGGGGSSGGRGTGVDDDLKGKVQQKIEADTKAFNFWDAVQSGLETILHITGDQQTAESDGAVRPSFHINRMTGTVMVTATKHDLEQVERYLTALKNSLNRQVIIEARIFEVTLSKGMKYGFDWSWVASGSTRIETNNFGSVINPDTAHVQVHITTDDFTGVLRAIESQGTVKMLSNPRVNIMNGQSALLSVGRSQTFLSAIETNISNNIGGNPVITYTTDTSSVLSGVMIGIVPYINENGELAMSITPIISELIRLEERPIGKEGTAIALPTVDLRQLSTTVKVKDNEMIIIGGLVQTKRKTDDNYLPIIGRIPLIGYLFKRFDHSDEQTDIIILLKPQLRT